MTNDQDLVDGGDGVVRDCQHTQVTHQHGTRRAYVADRCRCARCRQANTLAARERTTAIAYGIWPGLVDAGPARAHIQTLRAAGLSLKHVATLSGVARGTLDALVYGEPSRQSPPTARVHSKTEQRLLAVRFEITALPMTARIVATGSRRRLQALAVLGWSIPALAARTALTERTLRATLTAKSVSVATATEIAAHFDQLGHTQPPAGSAAERDAACVQARQARAAGWRPPQAWEDIDSEPEEATAEPEPGPAEIGEELMDEIAIERAISGEPVTLTAAERREAVARLTARGRSAQRIAELLHMSHRAVARWRGLSGHSAA